MAKPKVQKIMLYLLCNNSVNSHLFSMIQHVLESAEVGEHNDVNNRTIFETSKIHLCYIFIHQGEFLSHRFYIAQKPLLRRFQHC